MFVALCRPVRGQALLAGGRRTFCGATLVVWTFCRQPLGGGYRSKTFTGSGGIRTHASEETGALNQRLRPLGHATSHTQYQLQEKS